MLETNTLATVHQRLRDEHGVTVSDSSLRRYVAQVFPDRNRAAVTVPRPPVPPGEAQIDYGYLGRWLDPLANRIRRVWASWSCWPVPGTCSCGRCSGWG